MARPKLLNTLFAFSFVLVAGLPAAGAVLDTPETGQAAVLFNPRLSPADQMHAIAQAGVEIVRFGGVPGAVIVNMTEADSPDALRAAGAWLIADPIILGGCAVTTDGQKEFSS